VTEEQYPVSQYTDLTNTHILSGPTIVTTPEKAVEANTSKYNTRFAQIIYSQHHYPSLLQSTGQALQHRNAHGLGQASNSWSRLGENNEGEGDGQDKSVVKVFMGGVVLGGTAVAVAVMVWSRVKKDCVRGDGIEHMKTVEWRR
jgi:hypothetical protein